MNLAPISDELTLDTVMLVIATAELYLSLPSYVTVTLYTPTGIPTTPTEELPPFTPTSVKIITLPEAFPITIVTLPYASIGKVMLTIAVSPTVMFSVVTLKLNEVESTLDTINLTVSLVLERYLSFSMYTTTIS